MIGKMVVNGNYEIIGFLDTLFKIWAPLFFVAGLIFIAVYALFLIHSNRKYENNKQKRKEIRESRELVRKPYKNL